MKSLSPVLLLLVVGSLGVGCTVNRPAAPCTTDADCPTDQVCLTTGRCGVSTIDAGIRPDTRAPACPGGGTTSVSGIVRIPAGTLPVPGAVVYVASAPPADIPTGV